MEIRDVFITGVHTGLGLALATRFLDDGARVYAVSRTEPESLRGRENWKFRSVDLREHRSVGPELASLLAGVHRLDLAILNAGVLGPIRDLAEISVDELAEVQDLNVWANKTVIDSLAVVGLAPKLVVGISSGAAVKGSGGWGPYAVSKAGLNLLLQAMADERPHSHFIALAPGIVDTPMTRSLADMAENPRHPATGRVRAAIVEGRALRPHDAARNIRDRLDDLLDKPSGSYVDIRDL